MSKTNILIVEDESIVAKDIQNSLVKLGYEVIGIANNGKEAIEKIIEKSGITVPAVLVEHELKQMLHRLAHDVKRAGLTLEQYLKNAGKTEDGLRTEWRDQA